MPYDLLQTIHGPADLKALSVEQLKDLAQDIRNAICDQVARTGGHLAPNLGVVELTLAMHYVFDFGPPRNIGQGQDGVNSADEKTSGGGDRLLFDVGHQCYPHKLITGRLPMLDKLRTAEGMAGFPEPRESDYDLFSVGHAGTAISTAVGMARGDQFAGQADRKCVTLIGDASIVNGVALEGLNNAGTLKRQFLVVLNDNGMSIAKPQGAMAGYFDRVRVSHKYTGFKERGKKLLDRVPGGSALGEFYHRSTDAFKAMIASEHLFEHFGLVCVGPVDGHDLDKLIPMLQEIKDIDRPVLLHAKTIKGKGFDFSTGDPTTFHSPKPFTVNGCRVDVKSGGRSFTAAYADAMIAMMEEDESIVAVTAAMPDGTGLTKVGERFPDRMIDTGICESHAMDMCAGMAKAAQDTKKDTKKGTDPVSIGVKPFFAVYSTFAQRAVDQVFQEVALQGLPVRVCMDRAGFVGGDGAVHHGFMDIAMLRPLPGVVQLAPCDEDTLKLGLKFMAGYEDGATFIRYPRDNVPTKNVAAASNGDGQAYSAPPFELGKAHQVHTAKKPTPDVAILAYGMMVNTALAALPELDQQGYDVAVYDARFAMPVDIDLIESLIKQGTPIITIEDHALDGGFGSIVLDACHDRGLPTQAIRRMAMPKKWFYQDSRDNQLAAAGLTPEHVARHVRELLDQQQHGDTSPSSPAIDPDPARLPK
ncbi:1-deoxy-D-xylulose-5-phosphate synthase [Phycisphaeraceae bacterium D3-23]